MPRSTRIVTQPTDTISTKPVNTHETRTPEPLYTEAETAEILRTSRLTLRRWRINGTGPRHTKMGKLILYRSSEIERYIEERTSKSAGSSGENEGNENKKEIKS